MWGVLVTALLVGFRRRLGLAPRTWRIAHTVLAVVIVAATVAHGMLIEGAMETVSKAALCVLVLAATVKVITDLRVWRRQAASRPEAP